MAHVNIAQMRDFLDLFNHLSETCFNHCVYTFGYRELTEKEGDCVSKCMSRFLAGGEAIMKTFVEVQPQITERKIEEMNRLNAQQSQ